MFFTKSMESFPDRVLSAKSFPAGTGKTRGDSDELRHGGDLKAATVRRCELQHATGSHDSPRQTLNLLEPTAASDSPQPLWTLTSTSGVASS